MSVSARQRSGTIHLWTQENCRVRSGSENQCSFLHQLCNNFCYPRSSNYKISIYNFQIEAGHDVTSKAAEKRIPADGSFNILTPNNLLLGIAKGNPAADSAIVDNSSKSQCAQLAQEVTDHFWQRWASEVTPVRVIRQRWHESK